MPVPAVGVMTAVNVIACPVTDGFKLDCTVTLPTIFTAWINAPEFAGFVIASPAYEAVMEWVPAVRVVNDKAALPDDIVAAPIAVAPSKNCNVPVAVAGVTVAVNAKLCPTMEGFALDAKVIAAAAFMVCVIAEAVVEPAVVALPL